MMLDVKLRDIPRVVVALLVALALLSACSGDDDDPPSPVTSSALPTDDELADYFGAVASYDPARLEAAVEVAAPGSPAEDYLGYLRGFAASAVAGGQPVEAAEAAPVEGGFEACGGSGAADECVTWSDLVGEGGALADFSVDDVALDDSLIPLGDQEPISPDGLFTVQPTYAYESPQSGSLFVLVEVTATDIPLEVQPQRAIYVEAASVLTGVESRSPTTVEPGATQTVILPFPDAQDIALDGQVTFDVTVGGQAPQSVGFGLVAPAA